MCFKRSDTYAVAVVDDVLADVDADTALCVRQRGQQRGWGRGTHVDVDRPPALLAREVERDRVRVVVELALEVLTRVQPARMSAS